MAEWLLYSLLVLVALYAALVLAFVWRGRREDARALAGSFRTALPCSAAWCATHECRGDTSGFVAALIPYLVMPIDLVPDVPVAGQLDDPSSWHWFSAGYCVPTEDWWRSYGRGLDHRLM